jgi:hypothetical protein
MLVKPLVGLALGILVLPIPAIAAVTFDFTGRPANNLLPEATFSDGGLTLKAIGNSTTSGTVFITRNRNGLGICSSAVETDCPRGTRQIDSRGPDETLHFDVTGGGLQIETISFNAFNTNNINRDRFRLFVDRAEITSGAFKPLSDVDLAVGSPDVWNVGARFGPVVAYSDFAIRAAAFSGAQSSFRVSGLSGTMIVSEPTTLSVFGVGLLGLGCLAAWRSRRASRRFAVPSGDRQSI